MVMCSPDTIGTHSGEVKLESRSSDEELRSPTQVAKSIAADGDAKPKPSQEPGQVSIVLSPASADNAHARTNGTTGVLLCSAVHQCAIVFS